MLIMELNGQEKGKRSIAISNYVSALRDERQTFQEMDLCRGA